MIDRIEEWLRQLADLWHLANLRCEEWTMADGETPDDKSDDWGV